MNPLNFFLISMISILWSAAGLIFLLWAVSKYAERFNRSQTGWVILAIFFSPFLAFLGLYMVGKRKVNISVIRSYQGNRHSDRTKACKGIWRGNA